VKCCCNKIA